MAYSLAQRWPDILPAALPDHVQRLLELHAGPGEAAGRLPEVWGLPEDLNRRRGSGGRGVSDLLGVERAAKGV